jgi:hypothetical protein
MNHFRQIRVLLLSPLPLVIVVCAALIGCDVKNAVKSQPPKEGLPRVGRPNLNPSVELPPSDARIELISCEVSRHGEFTYLGELKYRFTKGSPRVGREYRFEMQFVDTPHRVVDKFTSKQLDKEGTLNWVFAGRTGGTFNKLKPAAPFTLTVSEDEIRDGRTEFVVISNKLAGTYMK